MKRDLSARRLEILSAAVAVVACLPVALLLLSWWLGEGPERRPTERLPTTPAAMATLASSGGESAAVQIRGAFARGDGLPGGPEGSWPRFRGADFDNIGAADVPLARRWGSEGPPLAWSLDLGEGHGGAAVHRGRVYLLDYDQERESDLLRCLSLADGREIWRRWYRTGAKRNHGISRTVPAVTDDYVVTIGPRCHAMCVDARTGEFLWGIDLVREYGTREPLWFTAQHPLIDGGVAVIAPGGRSLMIGVDCATGEVLWETPNPRDWQMSHSSVMPMALEGRKVYLYAALGGLAGVGAEGEDAGRLLFASEEWNHSVVAPSPLILGGGRILLTAGYGVGSALLRVSEGARGLDVVVERRFDRREFACEQQTPLYRGGLLYTVMPKDGGALREQFLSMTPGGERIWASGREHRFGLGPFMAVGERFFVLADDGRLSMFEAAGGQLRLLARARVLQGRDAWAPMAYAGGLLLLRDSRTMVCLDLRSRGGGLTALPAPRPRES